MIGVTFALPSESRDFRRLIGGHHREVTILHTGVGGKICRARIGAFLDSQRFDCLISSGFAGAVEPSLGVGDLFLAENFSDPRLLDPRPAMLIARVGKLTTADHVIEGDAERAALRPRDERRRRSIWKRPGSRGLRGEERPDAFAARHQRLRGRAVSRAALVSSSISRNSAQV